MLKVVKPTENFRGMSYGDWAIEWNKWLMSRDPDNYDGSDMLYLRSNIEYDPHGFTPGKPMEMDPNVYYETSREIDTHTAIFIPLLTSTYSIGEICNGEKLNTERDMRRVASEELYEPHQIWALVNGSKIVPDLSDYLFETPLFELEVTGVLNYDRPLEKGVYKTISKGYFILLGSLEVGRYDINFGTFSNVGETYYTKSIYHINVTTSKFKMIDNPL